MSRPLRSVRVLLLWLLVLIVFMALIVVLLAICVFSAIYFEQRHALIAMAFAVAGIAILRPIKEFASLVREIACDLFDAMKARRW